METLQFCTFRIDDLFLGVEVEVVQEVLRFQRMTPVPLAACEIRGLINLRGQIVTAIDLRRRLELPDRPKGELPMNVVIRHEEGSRVSFLVDEIGDVVEVSRESFEPTPATLKGVIRDLVDGVYKLDGQLMLVLNADKSAEIAEQLGEEGLEVES